jgi:hypothetical protein
MFIPRIIPKTQIDSVGKMQSYWTLKLAVHTLTIRPLKFKLLIVIQLKREFLASRHHMRPTLDHYLHQSNTSHRNLFVCIHANITLPFILIYHVISSIHVFYQQWCMYACCPMRATCTAHLTFLDWFPLAKLRGDENNLRSFTSTSLHSPLFSSLNHFERKMF